MTSPSDAIAHSVHIAHAYEGQEKPRAYRPRVFKGATIIVGTRSSEISCILRNQHEGGAGLLVGADVVVPAEFILYVPIDGVGYRSLLCWHHTERAGVRFVGIEPKPRHHYG